MVIDFHAHVLPGIDDGAKDLETSVAMLGKMAEQGVDAVVATPHFYADMMTVDGFLRNREAAFAAVEERREAGWPRIILGAEVAFFPGISRAARTKELAAEGRTLLLEMPFRDWTKAEAAEAAALARNGFHVALAHIERFMSPANEAAIDGLLSEPNVRAQVNADSLADGRRGRRLARLFEDGRAKFVGSDCHGARRRPPNLPKGREALSRALGAAFLDKLDEENGEFLEEICRKKRA